LNVSLITNYELYEIYKQLSMTQYKTDLPPNVPTQQWADWEESKSEGTQPNLQLVSLLLVTYFI